MEAGNSCGKISGRKLTFPVPFFPVPSLLVPFAENSRRTFPAAARTAAFVLASVAVSTLGRVALNPVFGQRVSFITFIPALVFSAWIGGWASGIAAIVLSLLAALFLADPIHTGYALSLSDQVTFGIFVVIGLSICAISSAQHQAQRDAEASAEGARQAARALQDSESRKAAVLEAALDCIISISSDGRIAEFNPAAEKTFGYSAAEVLGRPVAETVIPPSLRPAHHAGFDRYFATGEGPVLGQRIEIVGMRKSGEEFPVELAIVPMEQNGAAGFTAYLRDISERQALEDEQSRLAEANRLLLESTGEGIYGIDLQGRLTFVNQAAARSLGYTPEQMIGQNGHALIHGRHLDGSLYPEAECPIYQAVCSGESGHSEDEVFWRRDGTAFPVSYTIAPIVAEEGVQGAVVTFADISERRAMEDERERITQREHKIAEQLQEALQPPLPPGVPGLTLAHYYRPVLEEAGVGGDFADVFAADKGATFLVVGDLSGKGLAAASQVAIVRNMLRFALYNGRTVAGPVATLSRTLADNDLLTGFATLFVGRYEASERVLRYVNCGQDAGLLLRGAVGQVESLPPTGPVLGAFSDAAFTEESVHLHPGDVLALFTDGLTEAGPSRTALLTGEGVAALLHEAASGEAGRADAESIVQKIMAGVDAYAETRLRDDQCLLVAVAS